jgi:hypothetical protein
LEFAIIWRRCSEAASAIAQRESKIGGVEIHFAGHAKTCAAEAQRFGLEVVRDPEPCIEIENRQIVARRDHWNLDRAEGAGVTSNVRSGVDYLDAKQVEEPTAERDFPLAAGHVVEQCMQFVAYAGLTYQIREARTARERTEPSRRHSRQWQRVPTQAAQQLHEAIPPRRVRADDREGRRDGKGLDKSSGEDEATNQRC